MILTFEKSRLIALSKMVIPAHIQLYYQILLTGKKELCYAPSYRIGFEMIMLRVLILLDASKNNNSQFIYNDNNEKISSITDMITNQGAFTSVKLQ